MLYFYNTFASVFRRLGYENDVFGHAWTLLGHCLDAFRMAFSLPKDVCLNTRISSCLTIASFFPAVFCQACNFLRCRYLPTMAELWLSGCVVHFLLHFQNWENNPLHTVSVWSECFLSLENWCCRASHEQWDSFDKLYKNTFGSQSVFSGCGAVSRKEQPVPFRSPRRIRNGWERERERQIEKESKREKEKQRERERDIEKE